MAGFELRYWNRPLCQLCLNHCPLPAMPYRGKCLVGQTLTLVRRDKQSRFNDDDASK